ncbi:ATP-binding protein [Candidatus Omnitrophota bacterium]
MFEFADIGLFSITGIIIIGCLVILATFIYLIVLTERQRQARQSIEHSLAKLKKAYDELDEQAKIIVKKDLELNKTQEELDKKINSLYALHKLSRAISSTFDSDQLFSQINKSFISELGFDKGLVALVEPQTQKLNLAVAVGYPSAEQEKIKNYLSEHDILNKLNEPFLADENILLTTLQKGLLQVFNLSSFCCVPVISQEDKLGLIMVGSNLPYSGVTAGDLEILAILAGQIASGLENAKLYEQLWRSHQELEQGVAQRTKELAQANEKLKKIDKLKSEFVNAVSHELRTPLTSIKGYAAILMAGKLGQVPDAVKQRLEKINKHSDSLTDLVNNLLDLSRIEAGKVAMKLEKLEIKALVDEAVDLITPPIKEKKIQLAVNLPAEELFCLGDRIQLGRVLTNLLSNAAKFTPEKGKISIDLKADNKFIKIDIQDSGIGIAEDDAAKIFDEFYRVDTPLNQKVKGTGLGLSLVKHIVEAHRGRIWLDSKVGRGARFSFTIPKA